MIYTLSAHAETTIHARNIQAEWIEATIEAPSLTIPHPDDTTLTEVLRVIPEHGNRVLRVIYNHDKSPPHIVTAYFDRTMKGKV